jgi:hypothetical protein
MSTNPLPLRPIAVLAAAGWLAAFCLTLLLARSWKASHKSATAMRIAFSTQQNVIDQAAEREKQRDAALGKNLADHARADRAVKTPAAIAALLPSEFLALPRPLGVTFAPSAPDGAAPEIHSESARSELAALITVPQPDLKPMFDQLEACRACAERLAVAQQDLADEQSKISALAAERDAAATAARGGAFWSRLRLGAKWFLIGGAAGALAVSAARH